METSPTSIGATSLGNVPTRWGRELMETLVWESAWI